MTDSASVVPELIDAVRRGDSAACNRLLARYQPWLNLLARLQIDTHFQRKFDASDVVQQTMLAAFRDFPQFRGTTEAELTAWLRQILAHALAHEVRRFRGTAKRDVDRERAIERQLNESSQRLQNVLAADDSSPSQRAVRHEEEVLLAEVLERLPDDCRQVIVLRNVEGLSHEKIARRMDRNVGAVRMLWVRALARLRREIGTQISHPDS